MAPTTLTEYERKRLDNIHRNGEMMASLKLHSIATDLNALTKRQRNNVSKPKKQFPNATRQSMRTRGMLPDFEGLPKGLRNPRKRQIIDPMSWTRRLGPFSTSEAFDGDLGSDGALIQTIVRNGRKSEMGGESLGEGFGGYRVCEAGDSFSLSSMTLKAENTVRILQDGIMAVKFFPCSSSRMILAGTLSGYLGFWNLDHDEEEDGVYSYHVHPGPISGISIQPHCLSRVFTSCHDGFIRLMDAEREVFDLVYSSQYSVKALSQRSNDMKCLYFGEGSGVFNIWDEQMGKCSMQRMLHSNRIYSIDFNSGNPNLVATSSCDGTACIWDLRSMHADKPKALKIMRYRSSVNSAYFSPSGKCLATTSSDNKVGIHSGVNFEETSTIRHTNRKTKFRMFCPFRAIWGWDDSHLFIGSVNGPVDVISPAQRKTIFTLESPYLSTIPRRFDAHPYNVGMLAGVGGRMAYVWTLK